MTSFNRLFVSARCSYSVTLFVIFLIFTRYIYFVTFVCCFSRYFYASYLFVIFTRYYYFVIFTRCFYSLLLLVLLLVIVQPNRATPIFVDCPVSANFDVSFISVQLAPIVYLRNKKKLENLNRLHCFSQKLGKLMTPVYKHSFLRKLYNFVSYLCIPPFPNDLLPSFTAYQHRTVLSY